MPGLSSEYFKCPECGCHEFTKALRFVDHVDCPVFILQDSDGRYDGYDINEERKQPDAYWVDRSEIDNTITCAKCKAQFETTDIGKE